MSDSNEFSMDDFTINDSSMDNVFNDNMSIGGDSSEFIVGGDELMDKSVFGGSSNAFVNLGVTLLIVVVILILWKMLQKKKHRKYQHIRTEKKYGCPLPHSNHVDTFDNLLIPPSYFDYNQHGQEYINWTSNN
jgi:hypothetical protein